MAIRISENIKKLRRSRELTQEKLSEALGVSAQSVSKWECGENYPDIEILPAIAGYFEISVDELLGTGDVLDEKRLADAIAKTEELLMAVHNDKQAEIAELWENLTRDMPQNQRAQRLGASYIASYGDKCRAIAILERLLAKCTDNELRNEAIASLALIYADLKNFNRAREIADTLPPIGGTREWARELIASKVFVDFIQTNKIYKPEDFLAADRDFAKSLVKPYETAFALYISRAASSFTNILTLKKSFGLMTTAEYIEKLKLNEALLSLQYMDNPEQLDKRPYYHSMFSVYLETGDYEKALDYVEKFIDLEIEKTPNSAKGQRMAIGTNDDGNTTYERSEIPAREATAGIFKTPPFDPVKNHPRLIAAIERLMSN
ncbi:MAG: helix-turn-helix domain-containing protein [Oscillospiraceae bacterium]|jgi:transcriptional regulator with XRE-family HTH domain|nr:helix-turn-helix domain-containing protein [Oscillospiraceae bacterium]